MAPLRHSLQAQNWGPLQRLTTPDNITVGLRLIRRPQGGGNNDTSSSPQIYFNGTLNDIKDSKEYYGMGEPGLHFWSFSSRADLNCSRASEGKDNWDPSKGASAKIEPGFFLNGTLSNSSIVLHMKSTTTSKEYAGVEEPKPRVTNVSFSRTDIEITFSGRFDSRNSSQSLIINTTYPAITFSAGSRWSPCLSLVAGASGFICFYILL